MSRKTNRRRQNRQQAPPQHRPDTREVAVAQVTDKYSDYPSNGLTPVKLAEIFKEADAGDILRQAELFEEMEEKDPHLFSQLQTRKNAVTGLDFEIIPFGSDDERDKEIAEFVEAQINGIEGLEDIMLDLLDAIGKGFAVSEIMWAYEAGRVVVSDIRSRYQKRFFWDSEDAFRVRTDEAPEGMELPKNKFILHRYKARSGHPSRAGVLRVVAWMYLFKNYTLKDWVAFCEVYGMPLRLGKYQPGASEDDKRALMQALAQIGADAAGIFPDGTTIEFVNTEKASSTDLYERLARYCDEQVSKAILGQTLTSDSGGGSYAQSKTHNDVRHDLTVADCKALAATLRRDLIRPLVLFNFGDDTRVPYIRFDAEESEDLEQTANIIGTLIEKTGLKVPTSYIYKKFSIPKPEGGEEIAQPPQQNAGFGGLPFKQTPPMSAISLKAGGEPGHGTQERVDLLADVAIKKSAGTFKKAFGPVLKLLEKAESLEELRDMMENTDTVAAVFKEMDVTDVEELLQKVMIYADLEGGRSNMDGIESVFSRKDMTFEEAVDYFKGRVPVTAEVFYRIAEQYRGLAFTVSGYTKAQILKRFYDEILAALEDGNTFSEFRKNMNDFLKAEGYEGLDPLQADLIFRTNIQTAYNVGHYEQMTDPGVMKLRPFWQYDAVNDQHTRPSHLAMDGKVFPADSPVWNTWFPPNGFRCRCTVRTLSKRQVEARGLTVEDEFPAIAPDPHFGTNPAKVKFSPDMKGYPDALVKAYQNREKENPSP